MDEKVDCPYCDVSVDLYDTSDIRNEDELSEFECDSCGKKFGVRMYISYSYWPEKVDCWNGVDHRWTEWRKIYDGDRNGTKAGKVYERRNCEECDESEGEWHDKVVER